MGRVETIEKAVRKLSDEELATFREWFARFDAEAWDRELEADIASGKLDALVEQALAHHKAGTTRNRASRDLTAFGSLCHKCAIWREVHE